MNTTPPRPTGPIMLVTTNPANHKDDPKAKRSKSRTGGGSKKEKDAPIIVDGVLQPKKKKSGKSGKRGAGGGGGGGGNNNTGAGTGAGSRRQAGCMSLEEMFHIVFLSIAVGFLLVYLREVTIVSYFKQPNRGRFEW